MREEREEGKRNIKQIRRKKRNEKKFSRGNWEEEEEIERSLDMRQKREVGEMNIKEARRKKRNKKGLFKR